MSELLAAAPLPPGVELAIAPPLTAIDALREGVESLGIGLAAQNCHWETSGPFTGEIAAEMLAEAGCSSVIVGHSERRQLFGETNWSAGRKVAAAREAGLVPILCVGESETQRTSGRTEPIVERQLRAGLADIELSDLDELHLAYEPVWAIGTGRVATTGQAQQVHAFLRQIVATIGGTELAARMRILYGGSVKPSNAGDLASMPDVDGFLVGGASLEPDAFHQVALAAG